MSILSRLCLTSLLFIFCVAGCSPNLGHDVIPLTPSADAGSARIRDAEPIMLLDMGIVVPPPPRTIIPNGRALLVDFDMRHPMAWSGVVSGLNLLGVEVEYRRWFPHITDEDADGRFGMIVVGAGQGPGAPSPMMRPDSVSALARFAHAGGGILLGTAHSWEDTPRAANDIFRFNQLLETLQIRAWIESNTLVGDVFVPSEPRPPLHTSQPWAYVTALEWTLALPVAFPGPDLNDVTGLDALALGWAPSISCAGGDIGILTRAHIDAYAWVRMGGDTTLSIPSERLPVAVLAPANHGTIGIVPRSLLEMPFHSSVGADQPLLEPDLLEQTERMAQSILASWTQALQAEVRTPSGGCFHGTNPLPLASEAPDRTHPTSARPVLAVPPETELSPPTNNEPAPLTPPSWFRRMKGKLAYGELTEEASLTPAIDQVATAGMDGFVAYMPAEYLIDYDPEHPITGHIAAGAQRSELLGNTFFIAAHYRNAAYEDERDDVGPAIGAYGQRIDAPRPLSDTWWRRNLGPLIVGAAQASADNPGLQGLVLDLELYGAGALTYGDGYAFDDESWLLITEALGASDEPGVEDVANLPLDARLPWLVERGLVGVAYGVLETEVAQRARALIETARALNPDFQLIVYMHALQTTWFYRGLMRGLASAENPLVLLTYDQRLRRPIKALRAEGIPCLGLSGVLAVRLTPDDAETALFNAGQGSDGNWMFQFSDFDAESADRLHSQPGAYWDAFGRANARLDTQP